MTKRAFYMDNGDYFLFRGQKCYNAIFPFCSDKHPKMSQESWWMSTKQAKKAFKDLRVLSKRYNDAVFVLLLEGDMCI